MKYLLDTNVVSEVRKQRPDARVRAWLEAVPIDSTYLSALVVGEIRLGIEQLRRRDPTRAAAHAVWLASLREGYADRILPVSADIAEEWARLSVPDPLPVVDGLLAATARVHGLTLVTRNTADVQRTGVALVNPFETGTGTV